MSTYTEERTASAQRIHDAILDARFDGQDAGVLSVAEADVLLAIVARLTRRIGGLRGGGEELLLGAAQAIAADKPKPPGTAVERAHIPEGHTYAGADPEEPEFVDMCPVCWTEWPCLPAFLAGLPYARPADPVPAGAFGPYAEEAPF